MSENFEDYIGRGHEACDLITGYAVDALHATLGDDRPGAKPGDPLPPGWQSLFFLAKPLPGILAPDGLARETEMMPTIPGLPRRMFAGEEMTFHKPLHVGEAVSAKTVLTDISLKQGRTGKLAFITLERDIHGEDGLAIAERYHRVLREEVAQGAANVAPPGEPAPEDIQWRRTITADPVMLFRFSALTFNGHRIHYDRPYAMEEEGYPGLVVHGPLLSNLLINFAVEQAAGRAIGHYAMRARAPVFDTAPFEIAARPSADGDGLELWVLAEENTIAMSAVATFA